MKFVYQVGAASQSIPSLRGARQRPRPIIPLGIYGPATYHLRDCLLDTGADDTLFPESVATIAGIDLVGAPTLRIHLAGRTPVTCRYATIALRLTDGIETCDWDATIAFVPMPLQFPLLGYAGFYEYFDVEFRGGDLEFTIMAGGKFSGRKS